MNQKNYLELPMKKEDRIEGEIYKFKNELRICGKNGRIRKYLPKINYSNFYKDNEHLIIEIISKKENLDEKYETYLKKKKKEKSFIKRRMDKKK